MLDVNVPENGLLETDKSNPKIPVIKLDPDKVVTPDELDPYVTWVGLAQQASERLIGSLKDVNISYTPTTFSGQVFNKVEFDSKLPLGETPDGTPGVYAVDPESNFLLLAKRDKDGNQVDAVFYNNIDVNASPKQKIRLRTAAGVAAGSDGMIGYVTAKASRSNWYELTFDNPAVPLAALQATNLVIDIVTEDTENGDILSYNSNTEMWEPKEGGFVKKSGDTMTGTLTIEEVAGQSNSLSMGGAGVVKTRHLDSGNNSNLQIKRNGERRILIGDDLISFDKVAKYVVNVTITDEGHLTNKKYVDEKIRHDINFNNYPELT